MSLIEAWFDGACEPVNPGGTSSYGAVVMQDGTALWQHAAVHSGPGPGSTNNVAEYAGLIAVLEYLIAGGFDGESITVRGDSKLVIEQMSGRWRIRDGGYVPLAMQARALLAQFRNRPMMVWVPREQNGIADQLSKAALAEVGVTPNQRCR
jgi:ribonuclease HI